MAQIADRVSGYVEAHPAPIRPPRDRGMGLVPIARVVLFIALATSTGRLAAQDAVPNRLTWVGEARDARTGELLYRELHEQAIEEGGVERLVTDFAGPAGDLFATRVERFAAAGFAPEVELRDRRTEAVEGIRHRDGDIVLHRSRAPDFLSEERRFQEPSLLAAGAGVDRLVVARWDALRAGETVRFSLAVPSRLRLMEFELALAGERVEHETPTVTFQMVPSNPLIQLLAGRIRLTYHRDLRLMLRYEGPSSVELAGGGRPRVVVDLPVTNGRRRAAERPRVYKEAS